MNKYMKAFVATMLSANEVHAQNAATHEANAQSDDSAKRAAQRETTHANSAAKLATLSESALKLAQSFNIEASALEATSRENKKRTIAALNALAASITLRKTDSALDAALCYIVAKNTRELSLRIVMREAQHETTTQARYLLTFFSFIDAVESSAKDSDSKDVRFTLKNDHAFLNALVSLYSVTK